MFSKGSILVYFLVLMINIFQITNYLLYKSNVEMEIIQKLIVVNESILLEKEIITFAESIDYNSEYETEHNISNNIVKISNDSSKIFVNVSGSVNFNIEIDFDFEKNNAKSYKIIGEY